MHYKPQELSFLYFSNNFLNSSEDTALPSFPLFGDCCDCCDVALLVFLGVVLLGDPLLGDPLLLFLPSSSFDLSLPSRYISSISTGILGDFDVSSLISVDLAFVSPGFSLDLSVKERIRFLVFFEILSWRI